MDGQAIDNLNNGLKILENKLKVDDLAPMRVQLLAINLILINEKCVNFSKKIQDLTWRNSKN